jgi:hypothetical protein
MKELLKQWIKEFRCKHKYEMIEGTCHMIVQVKVQILNVLNVVKRYGLIFLQRR